jgi:predicted transcriptional regulator
METTEKKENEKADTNANTNSGKKEEKAWWESIAGNNPQLGAILKTLSNPLISAGSLAGLAYILYKSKEEKEEADKTKKENDEVKTEYNGLAGEYQKLKKKHKKLKKKLFGDEGEQFNPAYSSLNGKDTPKNPLYKTSFLD